ncbi:unnamed protein product [Linum tenue]|uniref:IAA-alanine resistance protein 1 n=1 Tax=Linum tenue TaxID=586396 RepID=A0AAV0JL36_9ROSI|nr:unnamed protein product [Linum tenue]
MGRRSPHLALIVVAMVAAGFCADLCFGDGLCTSPVLDHSDDHYHHNHHHHHDDGDQCGGHHHHHHHHHHDHGHGESMEYKLPEELAEEEDMKLYGFGNYHAHDEHDHHHDSHSKLSGIGLWINALGCSLLVSLASLICLIILPIIFVQGKPSKGVVDSLALFGAGAMLGDAFLHQLPHAFGGQQHSHSHSHHHADDLSHDHSGHEHLHLPSSGHSHSLEDLSVGLSILAGIVVFLLVEKLVRYVEDNSTGDVWGHSHHHHHKSSEKLKDGNDVDGSSDEISDNMSNGDKLSQKDSVVQRRKGKAGSKGEKSDKATSNKSTTSTKLSQGKEPAKSSSNLVFGYLNLFSDGVVNIIILLMEWPWVTPFCFMDPWEDGLGLSFCLHMSSLKRFDSTLSRSTENIAFRSCSSVGDFGILVRSGFSVSKALFFNFLSALLALVGTALGFTAGGFIYISAAGVLAEMNNGRTSLKSTVVHTVSLVLGMSVALCISLVE